MNRFYFPVRLVLFSLFPVFSLFTVHASYTPLSALAIPVLIGVGFALGLFWVLQRTLKEPVRAFFATFFLLFLFYSWTPVAHILDDMDMVIGDARIDSNVYLAVIFIAAAFSLFFFLKRIALALAPFHRFWLPLSLLLLLFPSAEIVYKTIRHPVASVPTARPVHPGAGIDIYYIVLDAYDRADILQSLFAFDNTPFIKALRERGFFVANKSRANYQNTGLAMSAALNYGFIRNTHRINTINWLQTIHRLHTNRLFRDLRDRGYHITAFDASGWEVVRESDVDDYERTPGFGTKQFLSFFLVKTLFSHIPIPFLNPDHILHERHRQTLLNAFRAMARKPVNDGAYHFVFGHVLLPHPPFVFDSTGAPIDNFGRRFSIQMGFSGYEDRRTYETGYRGQLMYTNQLVLALVDSLLARKNRPVIVLQSDHGSDMLRDPITFEFLDLHERFSNFTAVYFPDENYAGWDDAVSPVNTFRLVMNKYFGTAYGRLPDRSFFFSKADPGTAMDITDSLN